MSKSKEEKFVKRAWGIATADRLEWEVLSDNPQLKAEVISIQQRYNFQLSTKGNVLDVSWFGFEEPIDVDMEKGELVFGPKGQRRQELNKELRDLAKRLNIPPKWHSSLEWWVIWGKTTPDKLGMGFPGLKLNKEEGKTKVEIIITPETDIDNPYVIDSIRFWQAHFRDTPPQPHPIPGNRYGKLDWRYVWIWNKRHPEVSRKDIAAILHRDYTDVKRKLEQLDKELLE